MFFVAIDIIQQFSTCSEKCSTLVQIGSCIIKQLRQTFYVIVPLKVLSFLSVRTGKIHPVHKIVFRGLCQNLQSYKLLWTYKYCTFPSTHICLLLSQSSLHIWRKSFPPFEDLKIPYILFTPGNEKCLKLLLGICNTKKRSLNNCYIDD
jgi:hypothetical protein